MSLLSCTRRRTCTSGIRFRTSVGISCLASAFHCIGRLIMRARCILVAAAIVFQTAIYKDMSEVRSCMVLFNLFVAVSYPCRWRWNRNRSLYSQSCKRTLLRMSLRYGSSPHWRRIRHFELYSYL